MRFSMGELCMCAHEIHVTLWLLRNNASHKIKLIYCDIYFQDGQNLNIQTTDTDMPLEHISKHTHPTAVIRTELFVMIKFISMKSRA